jgi:DNA-binding NtrC family response regulator
MKEVGPILQQIFVHPDIPLLPTWRELREIYINEVLKYADGNKAEAARILGMNRRTIYRRAGMSS